MLRNGMIAFALVLGVSLSAVAEEKGEHYFANLASAGTMQIEMVIDKWSAESERNVLLLELKDNGQKDMMTVLENFPKAGWVRVPGGQQTSYDLQYAFKKKLSNGKYLISLLTNRPISLAEAERQNQSLKYDLSIIQLEVDEKGRGTGALVAGAEVKWNKEKEDIETTPFQGTPTKLVNVYSK